MNNNKYLICGIAVVLLLIPIIINFLCLTKFPAPLIGNGELWLNFWGVYIGAIITGSIAIYVCYSTINSENKRFEYNQRRQQINQLAKCLADAIAQMKEAEFYTCLDVSQNNWKNEKKHLQHLLLLHMSERERSISSTLLYIKALNLKETSEALEFMREYQSCYEDFKSRTREISRALKVDNYQTFKETIQSQIDNHPKNQFYKLQNTAEQWIYELRKKTHD